MRKVLLLAALTLVAGCDQPKDRAGKGGPPAPPAAAQLPAWAAGLEGKPMASAFAAAPATACTGYVDGPQPATAQGVTVVGWSWLKDIQSGAPQIVLTDAAGNMVAFGAGGVARPDVPAAVKEITRPDVGWTVTAPAGTTGVFGVWGVDPQAKTACRLGETRL